jgi:hypothetical protein
MFTVGSAPIAGGRVCLWARESCSDVQGGLLDVVQLSVAFVYLYMFVSWEVCRVHEKKTRFKLPLEFSNRNH